jgi:hypothetical protein
MKSLVLTGVVIIIISTLFIVLIFNTLIKANLACLGRPDRPEIMQCSIKRYNIDMIMGLMLVGFLTLLDFGSLYLVLSNWKPEA